MNNLELPKIPFSLERASELYKNGLLKDNLDVKNYINEYFFQCNNGTILFWDITPVMKKGKPVKKDGQTVLRGEWTLFDKYLLADTYLNRIIDSENKPNKSLSSWFQTTKHIYRPVINLNEPLIYKESGINFINLSKQFLHRNYKPYKEYSGEIKANCKAFLSYIKEVICSSNEEHYRYIIKWIGNMVQGNKNDSILYLKGVQGIGKSTLTEMLKDYIIGNDISLETGSEPLKSQFNKILMGRLLVVFEELETFSKSEWMAVSSKLKRYTTSNTIDYEDKNEKKFQGENINNYIINTNNDALKDSDGRRIFICDVSTHRKNDREYFKNLRAKCFNYEVGEALFSYFLEVEINGFNAQADMPMTSGKLDAIADRLGTIEKFLKSEYVLKQKSICTLVENLFQEYLSFCMCQGISNPKDKIKFCSGMRDLNLDYSKSNKINKYDYKYDVLKSLSDREHWVHELDEINEEEINDKDAKDLIIEQLREEIEKLKQELKEKPKKKKPVLTDDDLEKELELLMK